MEIQCQYRCYNIHIIIMFTTNVNMQWYAFTCMHMYIYTDDIYIQDNYVVKYMLM